MISNLSPLYRIVKQSRSLLEAYPTMIPKCRADAEKWIKQWREQGSEYVGWDDVPYDTWFDGKDRVYLPIDEVEEADEVDPPEGLDEVLEKYGFEILDLEKGLAKSLDPKNAKNTYGIGKILARHTKAVQASANASEIEEAKNLVDDFAKYLADIRKQQSTKATVVDEDHLIAISRDPLDIFLMSTDRAWDSCQNLNPNGVWASNAYHIPAHILRAGLIAYVIRKDDLEIKDPDARILIIPYKKKSGGLYLRPATYQYARDDKSDPQVVDVINRWLESKQGDLDEVAEAPYLQFAHDRNNPDLYLYADGNPSLLTPNNPRAAGVLDSTLRDRGGADIVANWLAQGKIRPTTELLMQTDAGGYLVVERYVRLGKGVRSLKILKLEYVNSRGQSTSVMGEAIPVARDTDFRRYVEKAVEDPSLFDLPAGSGKTVLTQMTESEFFPSLPSSHLQQIGKIAEQKYPSVFSSMVVRGLVPPPDASWYAKTDRQGEANFFALLAAVPPAKLGEIPISVFSSRLLKMENRAGQSVAFVLLQYMLKNRMEIQHLPSVKAIKETLTSNTAVMAAMTKTAAGHEPLVCWWAKNRRVFWTDDPKLLPLRSVPQGGRTLAHILAENHEKNKWIPSDRKVLNWVFEEEGRSISVRDILISKGVTQGLGAVAQPRKRVGGVQNTDDLGESRNHSIALSEYRQYLPYALTGASRETTLDLLEDPEIKKVLMKATGGRIAHLDVDDDGYVNVDGSVDFEHVPITKIPVPFGRVLGYFDCRGHDLQTLENAPKFVGGNFFCQRNKLQTLEGAPTHVGGAFFCEDNNLRTLEGAPTSVGSNFYYLGNPELPQEEVERYRASGAVHGDIVF